MTNVIPSNPKINIKRVTGYWCFQSQIPKDKSFNLLKKDQWLSLPAFNKERVFDTKFQITDTIHVIDDKGKAWFILPDERNQSH